MNHGLLQSLHVAGVGGSLDLEGNSLILEYMSSSPIGDWQGSSYDGVTGMIQDGRLQSSSAIGLKILGVAEARMALGINGSQTASFAGQTVDSTSILMMLTYGGDATLDGRINIDDYGRIDSNVAQSGSVFGWFNGDFNYDGKINIDDYGIIDSNTAAQGTPLPEAGSATAAAPSSRGREPELVGLATPSVWSSSPVIDDDKEERLWAIDGSVLDRWA